LILLASGKPELVRQSRPLLVEYTLSFGLLIGQYLVLDLSSLCSEGIAKLRLEPDGPRVARTLLLYKGGPYPLLDVGLEVGK
jgi:hypothetical protein